MIKRAVPRLGHSIYFTMTLAGLSVAFPQSALHAQSVEDLQGLSIEELVQVEVTSASKRAEPLSEAPAAIYVISNDDIRRSGASSLPEALRLAPNLDVQRIDALQYSVSARGFAGYETSNKLLVLIDGRSVYSTLHSGVFWDLRQVFLEDVDQVEVISGPGGLLWGTNAVNGVINITSRSAADTQGALVRAAAGTLERTAGLRYGDALGSSGAYRVYAAGYDREGLPAGRGGALRDGGDGLRAGFRADWTGGGGDFTLQGDIFDQSGNGDGGDSGHNLLARWNRSLGRNSSIEVQAYYDQFERRFSDVYDAFEAYDLAVQHNWTFGAHQIVWGAGIRATHDKFINNANPFVLDPPSRTLWMGNVFAQDTWAIDEKLSLTGGLKLERTSFTGIEALPSVRLAWRPAPQTLFWTAASRAVRTPSRIDRQLVHPVILEAGTFRSERLTALEAGYRGQLSRGTSVSLSIFYNLYDGLRTTEPNPATFLPVRLSNGLKGHSYGVEAWGSAQVADWWRVSAGIRTLHKSFRLKAGRTDIENGISLGNDPDFQLLARSQMNLTDALELDVTLRGVDRRPDPRVSGYVDADARIGWALAPQLELYVAGTNLLHAKRDESGDADRGQLVRRSIVAGARFGL